ncbi:protein TolR [Desulfurispira natronophila]|uniref:Biopolymer transport protein TolR n=1 Tax=Desulfurispira natronophila TaxID=682562 RepID=A0A7W7Y5R7_9BACT|nr:protein TolR [Desulfurispira natronophila]MBB5022568.1 biopolymer transport protein TolR [Desulfurispira natronophila]
MKIHSDVYKPMSDINVIPLVDVVLVLLIIFMITAPMLQHGMHVDLPESQAELEVDDEREQLILTVDEHGQIFINRNAISLEDLPDRLEGLQQLGQAYDVIVEGDRHVDYGAVVSVMDVLQAAGFYNIGLVTQ